MISRNKLSFSLIACAFGAMAMESSAAELSDEDYFTEMPVVLSVTRLAQSLHDSPASVTVIDREMIAKTGARSVADLMKFVPGFLVTQFDGAARPYATYHADGDNYNRRLQVFIDGRSVYSGLILGSATYGLLGIALDEIERIEVIRGSNSASQGANAYLGVVNITTRHAMDTVGGALTLGVGDGGIKDGSARLGWGDNRAAFRLSVGNRRDNGFENRYDNSDRTTLNFRADLNPSLRDEITLSGGYFGFDWGTNPGQTNPNLGKLDERYRSSFAQVRWHRHLAEGSEIRTGLYADEEQFFQFTPMVRGDGRTRRTGADVQHTFSPATAWRMLWGLEYRSEEINSPYLFSTAPDQGNRLWRSFANIEWRASERWLFNAGGLHERHSITDSHSSPRYSANFMIMPGHTLRGATSTAFRTPTQFESRGSWAGTNFRATGQIRPERIDSSEIGYLGEFRQIGLMVDFRGFVEKSRSFIKFNTNNTDAVNRDSLIQRGWETQLRWQPRSGTQLLANHTEIRVVTGPGTNVENTLRAPRHLTTLALFQELPADFHLSVTQTLDSGWQVLAPAIPSYRQTDIRLAKSFKWDGYQAEAALNILAAEGSHIEYSTKLDYRSVVDRRAFATLKVGF